MPHPIKSLDGGGAAPFVTIFSADGTVLWENITPPFVQEYARKHGFKPAPWVLTTDPILAGRLKKNWQICLAGTPVEGIGRTTGGTFRYHLYPLDVHDERAVIMIGRQIPNEILLISTREEQVLRRLARGWNVAKIASDLGIAKSTVEKHRENARKKLKCNNAQLLYFAMMGDL